MSIHFDPQASEIFNSCGAERFVGHTPQGVKSAVAMQSFIWQPGQILTIGFLDGAEIWRSTFMKIINEWTQYGNIKFKSVVPRVAMIRVSFKGIGHWSQIGSSCLQTRHPAPTLNIQANAITNMADLKRVVLHEIGHALGLAHEHQFPNGLIWDVAKTIDYYRVTQGWTAEMTLNNVINNLIDDGSLIHTPSIDLKSIMEYPIAPGLATDLYHKPVVADWTMELSVNDKAFFNQLYPKKVK